MKHYYVFLDELNNTHSVPKPCKGYQDVLDAMLERERLRGIVTGVRTIVGIGTAEELKKSYKIRWTNWEIKEDEQSDAV